MRSTKKQQVELIVWRYFMPSHVAWMPENQADIEKFFEWSEQGKHKENFYGDLSYFNALREGKSWAGVHMQMYEEGILDMTMPYFVILGGNSKAIYRKWWQFWKPKISFKNEPIPREVVDFMKKEMFKGIDADLIEKCYQSLL